MPAGWVSWVVRGQPRLGGTALNGAVQVRQDPADASTFSWARCVVQLISKARMIITMPQHGHVGNFYVDMEVSRHDIAGIWAAFF